LRLAFFAGKCYYKQETKGAYQMKMIKSNVKKRNSSRTKLVQEMYGGEAYEYYPLGKHIVAAPGVCGGRPTFKYTRLEVSMILAWLSTGRTIEQIVQGYAASRLTPDAVKEAILIANKALLKSTKMLKKTA
jgi:uncharacterized protein (DUF433 family)